MSEPITRDSVFDAISVANGAITAADGDYSTEKSGLVAIALSNLAVAQALLLQAEKQDELIAELRFVTSGGSGYLEVRTTEA